METLSVPGKGALIPAVRLSDHAPFWDLGYEALMLTDTSFYRNPHYHGATDSIETLDIDFMAKVCEGVVRGLSALLKKKTYAGQFVLSGSAIRKAVPLPTSLV